MYNVEIADNQTDFAKLLQRVLSGEEVIISQDGNPIARVVPIADKSLPRIPGLDKGKVVNYSDFDAHLPEDILNSITNSED